MDDKEWFLPKLLRQPAKERLSVKKILILIAKALSVATGATLFYYIARH